MSEHIKTYQQGHDGGIYLQCDPSLLHIIQTQVIPSIKKQHPDIQLNVSTNSREQIQESLLNASADYGVYFSCEEEHPLLDNRILDEDELVYCSKHDLLSDPLEHTKIMTVPKGNPLIAFLPAHIDAQHHLHTPGTGTGLYPLFPGLCLGFPEPDILIGIV